MPIEKPMSPLACEKKKNLQRYILDIVFILFPSGWWWRWKWWPIQIRSRWWWYTNNKTSHQISIQITIKIAFKEPFKRAFIVILLQITLFTKLSFFQPIKFTKQVKVIHQKGEENENCAKQSSTSMTDEAQLNSNHWSVVNLVLKCRSEPWWRLFTCSLCRW